MLDIDLKLALYEVDDARDLEVDVTIRNTQNRQAPLNILPLTYGPAVLEVRDAESNPVPLVPPSVPPSGDASGRIDLTPGAAVAFHYRGSTVFDAPLMPGNYAVRLRVTAVPDPTASGRRCELTSAWVPFVVAKRVASPASEGES